MVFITENNTTRIALPMKHLGTAGDWGSDIGTASLYVDGERAFPKNTNKNDLSLVGMFHEEFWYASGGSSPEPVVVKSRLPKLYASSKPGIVPGGVSSYLMRGWGFATQGSSGSQYYPWETGINVCTPIDFNVNKYSYPDFQHRYVYRNSDYAFWDNRSSVECKNYYSTRNMPCNKAYSVNKCAINYLFFNRMDRFQYFLARPYALLLFEDWTDAGIASYFNASGYNYSSTTLRFGFNFLTADLWQTPLDWDDIYVGAYVFDSSKPWYNNFGYHAEHHIVDKYTYNGHTYHIVTAGVAEKTVPASVASHEHTEACSPFGCISTPVFNVPYSNNVIQWSDLPAVYGFTYGVYVLEYGAEYYVGIWK